MKNEKRKTLPARLKTSMFGNFSGEKCTEEDLTGEQVMPPNTHTYTHAYTYLVFDS